MYADGSKVECTYGEVVGPGDGSLVRSGPGGAVSLGEMQVWVC